jgi:membrane-associated phospholipid phosphatase
MNPKLDVAIRVGLGSFALLTLWSALFLDRERLRRLASDPWSRIRPSLPYLGLLGAVLVVNNYARDVGPEVSWVIGWNITGLIHAVEGNVVAIIQSVDSPLLTSFFAFVYLPGYVSLLVFPFVAYLALDDRRPLQETAIAYAVTYAVGLVCYVLFISYGPRNLIPDLVSARLYVAYPQTQLLTGEVNSNTNVFPSLHASLSVAVAALAWRTRETYPGWSVMSLVTAACVSVSTMRLGIHWATDVVAGAVLGVASVVVAARVVDLRHARKPTEREPDAPTATDCEPDASKATERESA